MELKSKKGKGRKPERLGLKLGIIFGFSLVLTTTALMASSFLLKTIFNEKPAPPRAVVINPIDAKLEEDLVAALQFDEVPEIERATDPFVDREGLGREVTAKQQTNTGKSVISSAPELSSGPISRGQTSPSTSAPEEKPDPIEETKARWAKRLQDQRYGRAVSSESEVFDIEDLYPVAVAKGGKGRDEVIFYSVALERNISLPVGARLHNGWVSSIRADGVRFMLEGKQRTTVFKIWGMPEAKAKSEKNK